MATNVYRPHLFILPEDKANHDIANGFRLDLPHTISHQVKILHFVGGIPAIKASIQSNEAKGLNQYAERFLAVLVDFDGKGKSRYDEIVDTVPLDLRNRVFILGSLQEPENLRSSLVTQNKVDPNTWEKIGSLLATDCLTGKAVTWRHEQLKHNRSELNRLSVLLHTSGLLT